MTGDGILSGPLDVDAPRRPGPAVDPVDVFLGMVLVHRASGTAGAVMRYVEGQQLILRDDTGRDHAWRPVDGAFALDGRPVALRRLVAPDTEPDVSWTPSGSLAVASVPPRVARAARIWVEGSHDAELIEKVWGDDLRVEGVVVEPLGGADDLVARVRSFRPGPGRRLGVLLDHLVDGTTESRVAAEASAGSPHVLVCGHPYVDIWQAIRPATVGIDAWPTVPIGQPWKAGVMAALDSREEPATFWKQILGRVMTYRDLETPLINAVERLVDFVTAGDG